MADPVPVTAFAATVRGRYVRVFPNPTDPTLLRYTVAAWGGTYPNLIPAYETNDIARADLATADAVQTSINDAVVSINAALAP